MVPANASAKTHAAAKKVDIVESCSDIVAKHTSNPVNASLEMCARMALLVCIFAFTPLVLYSLYSWQRLVLLEVLKEPTLSVKEYWERVDKRLEGICAMFPNEPQKITR